MFNLNLTRMKKLSFILSLIIFGQLAFGQAVKDRNVIPVAVNLNQVLRMSITNGGNIEFAFNTIDDYKHGLSADYANLQNPADPDIIADGNQAGNDLNSGLGAGDADNFYNTNFTVASSTRWKLTWGAEDATFMGTDGNTMLLNNVGFTLVNNGGHNFETSAAGAEVKATTADAELYSAGTDQTESVCCLLQYPAGDPLIEDNDDPYGNGGDGSDNDFELLWRAGTSEQGQDNGGVVLVGPNPMNCNEPHTSEYEGKENTECSFHLVPLELAA